MRAAAQFDRISAVCVMIVAAHGEHAHFVAIFFAEQRFGAGFDRLSVGIRRVETSEFWRMTAFTWFSMRSSSSGVTGLGWREIEAQPLRRDQRTFLRHMRAQHALERGMQQMRGGMIGAGGAAAFAIHFQIDRIAHGEFALHHLHDMDMQAPSFFWVSDDFAFGALGGFIAP